MRTDRTPEEITPVRLPDEDREVIQNYITVLDNHAAEHIGAPFYIVIADPARCTLCYSRLPVNAGLWIPNQEVSHLLKHPDGGLFGGAVYFVCFECYAEIRGDVAIMAEELLKVELDRTLRGSGYFELQEAHR